ncbi:MAG: nucleotidyltransferase domain-containing protein [Coriobacteriia bacterium]|nr:nucleotidyltransferase domain-containing protein [Coriobacteriia bacterium]
MDSGTIGETILGTRSNIRVLRVLYGVSIALSARQISHQTGLTYPAVNTVLERLVQTGIVLVSRSGNTRLYQLERNSIYVEQVIAPLFWLERGLRDEIIKDVKQALAYLTESVVLFGSFARGDQTPQSDVDILIVVGDTCQKNALEDMLLDYSAQFYRRFGHSLGALVYDLVEARHLPDRAAGLYAEIKEDGYTICGKLDWMSHA